jgi:hypothetical protein
MRNRLIELLLSVPSPEVIVGKREGKRYATAWHIADHLLANGVIVPPVRVGDKIYMLVTKHTHSFTYSCGKMQRNENQHTFIKQTYLMESNFFKVIRAFGKTVFLTREDAEKALRKEDEK